MGPAVVIVRRIGLGGAQLAIHRARCAVPQFIDLGLEHTRRRLHGLAANDLPAELHDRLVFSRPARAPST